MKIALYGLPCAGKTTLMEKFTGIKTANGSETLKGLCNGNFSDLTEEEKVFVRIKYTEYICNLDDEIVLSDGHYAFFDKVVFTEQDGDVYDAFIYLYCNSDVLQKRYETSVKNEKYRGLSVSYIESWQQFEIENLRKECHNRNKDFYVIKSDEITADELSFFIHHINSGYSSFELAKNLVSGIIQKYPESCHIHLVDGDKTVVVEDSFRLCCEHKTKVFDGDFYTGYQSYCFDKETEHLQYDFSKLSSITLNNDVWNKVKNENYIILSGGITSLWDKLSSLFGFAAVFANPLISADTKYYVAKLLKQNGYTITAYGDSKNDLYMLKEADNGYLYIGKRISRSLHDFDLKGLDFIYDKSTVVIDDIDDTIKENIAITKSNSGINGSLLATAHIRLGERLGKEIKTIIPTQNTAVIVMERGGRFFGDGLYSAFGGVFYPYNPSKDEMPDVSEYSFVIIADSVINTGRSILNVIENIKQDNPNIEIIIAANVIQRNALDKMKQYKIFSIRVSDNYFIGKKQAVQTGDTGPDTAERLFNYISIK